MRKTFVWILAIGAAVATVGCSKPEAEHHLEAPGPRTQLIAPTTKEGKIAAIKRAPMSEEMKKAEIAKINASQ